MDLEVSSCLFSERHFFLSYYNIPAQHLLRAISRGALINIHTVPSGAYEVSPEL